MIVMKFGGTSVEDAAAIRQVAEIVRGRADRDPVLVVSAMARVTDTLLAVERLMERVWGYDTEVDTRSIDAHIRRLRQKLGPARAHVETVVGVGYRFVARSPV